MCSYTPRFSYGTSETHVQHVGTSGWYCRAEVYGRGMVPGWVYGWVYRVGNRESHTGYYPATARSLLTAKRAPEVPWGLEWVVRRVDA